MSKFLKDCNLSEWPQEEIEYMNSPITTPHARARVHTHPHTQTHMQIVRDINFLVSFQVLLIVSRRKIPILHDCSRKYKRRIHSPIHFMRLT